MNRSQLPYLFIALLSAGAVAFGGLAITSTQAQAADSSPDTQGSEEANDDSPPPPSLSDSDRQELTELVRQTQREVRNRSRTGGDTPLDVDAVLRQVHGANTPANIFRWMSANITYEPYTDSLRGVSGTLIARSANAVDQALLAHALLSEAGHDVRYVTGTLHRTDVTSILEQTLGTDSSLRDTDGSQAAVADASLKLSPATLRAVQDHIWLEVGSDDNARAFDPIASPTFGVTPAAADERHHDLPDRFDTVFEMTLRSHLDDGRTLKHLTVDGPLARVAFQALTLSFEDDPTRPRGHRPILKVGQESLRGTTIPVSSVERLELRFRFQSHHHENRWTQTLYHRGHGIDIFDFDHQQFAMAVAPGWTSEAKMRQIGSKAATDALETVERWLEQEGQRRLDDEERRAMITELLDHLGAALPFAFARTLDRTSDQASRHLGVMPVLGRPRVLTTGLLRQRDDFYIDLQIDGDRMEALPRTGVPSLASKAFVGLHGLIRDHLVSEMLESYGDHHVTTVRRIFQSALDQSSQFTTVGPHNLDRLQRLSIEDSTRQTMQHQIRERNMTLLTPLSPVEDDGVERFGWWAVNPLDGNLEGHTADAIVAVGARKDREALPIEALIRHHLELIGRHFTAAHHALGDEQRFPELACSAARQFAQLSRGFCATSQSLPRANINACLADPPQPETNLFNLTGADCADQFAPFRCASAYASALLNGDLQVVADQAGEETTSSPLCQ